jgi:hypothetical protein
VPRRISNYDNGRVDSHYVQPDLRLQFLNRASALLLKHRFRVFVFPDQSPVGRGYGKLLAPRLKVLRAGETKIK